MVKQITGTEAETKPPSTRILCCVPGCHRTYGNPEGYAEWLCRPHWNTIRGDRRRVYTRSRKKAVADPTIENRIEAFGLWEKIKDEAIQKAMGIR